MIPNTIRRTIEFPRDHSLVPHLFVSMNLVIGSEYFLGGSFGSATTCVRQERQKLGWLSSRAPHSWQ
ncbi:MAG: hypothetical protein ACJ0KD_04060 [Dehalococcoidia bacterium]